MSTKNIILWALGAVLVIGGGYLLLNGGSSQGSEKWSFGSSQTTGAPDPKYDTPGKAAFTGSWNDLVTRGGEYTCAIETNGATADSSGTVFVSGANLYGAFVSKTAAGTITSHMLKNGETMYMWSDAYPQGIKTKATTAPGSSSTQTSGQGISQSQSYSWNCVPGAGDDSHFVPPQNIKFMDLDALKGGQGMPSIPSY